MALLIDRIMDEDTKRKKSLEQKKTEAATGAPGKMTDEEWKAYIKKKTIEEMRAAGAKLASKS